MFFLLKKMKLLFRKKTTAFVVLSTFFIIFFGAFIMRFIEPETFNTYFDAVWYVCITLTTVGYGDFFPESVAGRIFALFLLFFGLGIITIFLGKIVDLFGTKKRLKEEGKVKFKEEEHLVVIGWSQKAKKSIEETLRSNKKIEVVLIDKDLLKEPISHERIHFIKGVPSHEETMVMANIEKAKAVIIFADEKVDAEIADAATMMIATRVEKMAPQAKTVVEVMDERNVGNFEHIKVDEFIHSHKTVSHLAVLAALSNGTSRAFCSLLSTESGDELYAIPKRENWKTYRDAFTELLEEGATLFSNGEDTSVNRKLNEEIPSDAQLNVICDLKTANEIRKKAKA